jgi:hypothetical protein
MLQRWQYVTSGTVWLGGRAICEQGCGRIVVFLNCEADSLRFACNIMILLFEFDTILPGSKFRAVVQVMNDVVYSDMAVRRKNGVRSMRCGLSRLSLLSPPK